MDVNTFVEVRNKKKLWSTFPYLMEILFYLIPEIQTSVYDQKISQIVWEFYKQFETEYNRTKDERKQDCDEKTKDLQKHHDNWTNEMRVRYINPNDSSISSQNGLRYHIQFLFDKMCAITNGNLRAAEHLIINYYNGDETDETLFTYNKHILIEMRSLFARIYLCQNNKIIKCLKCAHDYWKRENCIDCNNKGQLLIDINSNDNRNEIDLQLIQTHVFCDKLIEAIRPMSTQFKESYDVNTYINDMIECITDWITTQLMQNALLQIQTSYKILCLNCKTLFLEYECSQTMFHIYDKYYKLTDYLNECDEYLVGKDKYRCNICKRDCNAKRITYFTKLPKILIFDCDSEVSHSIQYPLIIDMNKYKQPNVNENYQIPLQNDIGAAQTLLSSKRYRNKQCHMWILMIISNLIGSCDGINIPKDVQVIIFNYCSDVIVKRFCNSIYEIQSKDLYILTGVVFKHFECYSMDLFDIHWRTKVKDVNQNTCYQQFMVDNSKWYYYNKSEHNIETISIYDIADYDKNAKTLFYRRFDQILMAKPQLNNDVIEECQFYYDTEERHQMTKFQC